MHRILIVLISMVATAAYADTAPAPTKKFIDNVAVANKFEIDTSQLALQYGKAPDVKTFAQQMIDDHTKAGEDFKASLAEAKIDPAQGRSRHRSHGKICQASCVHDRDEF